MSEEDEAPPRTEPTDAELAEWTVALLGEIEAALSSDGSAIAPNGSQGSIETLYSAAGLRHCAALLLDIGIAVGAGRELTVRILGRTHIEAFLYALYIHFGGFDAVMRVAQDTLASLQATNNDLKAWDDWLTVERKQKSAARNKIRRNNTANEKWNAAHPDQPQRPIFTEPYVPQLSKSGVDLGGAVAEFGNLTAQVLPVREVVDALTKWGPEKGFARESFRPMYLLYRILSGSSVHPTLDVLDAYFRPGGFTRTLPVQLGVSTLKNTWVTSLYGTAFLAGWVLGDAAFDTTVSNWLRSRLEPDPTGGRGWSPGI